MIYIQSDKERTRPHHFDCASAMFGCIENELPYRLTSFEEIASGKFDYLIPTHLFVGSVEFMREVFSHIGKNPRVPVNSDRPCETLTVKQIRDKVVSGERLFIKPFELKLFTGLVIDKWTLSCIKDVPESALCMVYEPFKSSIISEWRAYVYDYQIADCKNYSGDFEISPAYGYWNSVMDKSPLFDKFPCAFTMDIAVLENENDVIVEFNDMWAIGNYGMDNSLYLRMLRERYFEIVRNN